MRRAHERIASERLRKPQCAVAQMFQLAGEAGDFIGAERVEVGKDTKFSEFHGHSLLRGASQVLGMFTDLIAFLRLRHIEISGPYTSQPGLNKGKRRAALYPRRAYPRE